MPLIESCLHLQELNIILTEITDAKLAAIARCLPELRGLHIVDCSHVSDTGVLEIARQCTKIAKLSVSNIGSAALTEVAQKCRKMKDLHLQDCIDVQDHTLTSVGACCADLSELCIEYAEYITDATTLGVAAIAKCRRLTSLTLRNVLNTGDELLRALGNNCTNTNLFTHRHDPESERFRPDCSERMHSTGMFAINSLRIHQWRRVDCTRAGLCDAIANITNTVVRELLAYAEHSKLQTLQCDDCPLVTQHNVHVEC